MQTGPDPVHPPPPNPGNSCYGDNIFQRHQLSWAMGKIGRVLRKNTHKIRLICKDFMLTTATIPDRCATNVEGVWWGSHLSASCKSGGGQRTHHRWGPSFEQWDTSSVMCKLNLRQAGQRQEGGKRPVRPNVWLVPRVSSRGTAASLSLQQNFI